MKVIESLDIISIPNSGILSYLCKTLGIEFNHFLNAIPSEPNHDDCD